MLLFVFFFLTEIFEKQNKTNTLLSSRRKNLDSHECESLGGYILLFWTVQSVIPLTLKLKPVIMENVADTDFQGTH